MRAELLRRLSAALAVGAVAALAAPALAQEEPHSTPGREGLAEEDPHDHGGHGREIDLSQLTPDQRRTALAAWNHVYCKCPNENWSRILAGCPDGCADPQKQEILGRVVEGWDLDRIVAEQVQRYGERANAAPGTAVDGTLLVLAGLVIGAGAAATVLASWRRTAAQRRVVSEAERAATPVAGAEADAIERELREIE